MSLRPWLLTGASGFLGRHVLETLGRVAERRPVIALVRDLGEWHRLDWTRALTHVEPLAGSVENAQAWTRHPSLSDLEGILHLAALVRHSRREADLVRRVNVEGTLEMVRRAGDHQARLVFVSTSGTVGCFPRPGVSADEDAPHCEVEVARWPYYRSKVEAERESRELARTLQVELVIVRPPVLLGPGDHRFRSTGHVLRLLEGRLPFLVQGGMHFADVRDVAAALVRLMTVEHPRPIYHLPGTVCTIEEFYRMTAEVATLRPPTTIVPYPVAWAIAALGGIVGRLWGRQSVAGLPDPDLVAMASHHWAMHSRYAESELGYRNRPPRETLADTVAWLRANRRPAI